MWELTVDLSPAEGDVFSHKAPDDALSVSWFEHPHDPDRWSVQVHFENRPAAGMIDTWFSEAGVSGRAYTLAPLLERDWLAENRSSFPPIEIGSFYIYGSHIQSPPPPDKISFLIDAAAAFGTGQHGTTKGCLMALQGLQEKGRCFQNPLDMGCGTVILAMAIARLFNVPVMASDNDPDALEVVKTNLRLNNLDHLITPIEADGLSHGVLKTLAPYDLIVANILADPLIQLARDIYAHTKPGSVVILSGILEAQKDRVFDAYEKTGFRLTADSLWDEQWVTLVLER